MTVVTKERRREILAPHLVGGWEVLDLCPFDQTIERWKVAGGSCRVTPASPQEEDRLLCQWDATLMVLMETCTVEWLRYVQARTNFLMVVETAVKKTEETVKKVLQKCYNVSTVYEGDTAFILAEVRRFRDVGRDTGSGCSVPQPGGSGSKDTGGSQGATVRCDGGSEEAGGGVVALLRPSRHRGAFRTPQLPPGGDGSGDRAAQARGGGSVQGQRHPTYSRSWIDWAQLIFPGVGSWRRGEYLDGTAWVFFWALFWAHPLTGILVSYHLYFTEWVELRRRDGGRPY